MNHEVGKKEGQSFCLHSWTGIPEDLFSFLHPLNSEEPF